MKNILSVVFCVCLAFGFTACDSSGDNEDYYEGPYDSGEYNKIRHVRINGTFQDEIENYRFIMDEDVIGEWEAVDFVNSIENFDPGRHWWTEELMYTKRAFLPNGTVIASYSNRGGVQVTEGWTRGLVISGLSSHAVNNPLAQPTVVQSYTKARISGNLYMFVQFKSGDYVVSGREPGYYVFVKRSRFSGNNSLYNDVLGAKSAVEKEFAQWSGVQSKERGLSNMRLPFRMMWLVYTNGNYRGQSYKMTDAIVENFKRSIADFETMVESLTNNNVDIINEYKIIDRLVEGTNEHTNSETVAISPRTAKPEMDMYAPIGEIHFVYTVSAIPNPGVGSNYRSIYSGQGFASSGATGLGYPGHYLHEMLHSFEFRSSIPISIEMPLLHISCCEFPVGYDNYMPGRAWADNNSGDANGTKGPLFLTADVRYTDPETNAVSYVGLYPSLLTYVAAWHKYLAEMRTVAP